MFTPSSATAARRQLSVPVQPTHRSASPTPQSAAQRQSTHPSTPATFPTARARLDYVPPVRKRSIPLAARSTHPLQLEIERLTAVCEEHERVIRSSLSTLKHHLLTNVPAIFDRVHKLDDEAETITSSIQQSLQTHIPPYQAHLRKIVSDRSEDVDLMRQRTTPWREIASDANVNLHPTASNGDTSRPAAGVGETGAMKLKRVQGAEGGEMDALTKVEMWADEVEMYLSAEIVRAKERLAEKTSKRQFLIRVILYCLLLSGALCAVALVWFIVEKFLDMWAPGVVLKRPERGTESGRFI